MPLRIPKKSKSQIVRIGTREIETRGLRSGFWTDLFHHAMTVSWPGFFAAAAVIFLALNSAFAVLLFFGDRPVANAEPGRFLDLLYFSIETLATVGYGDMHPQTDYGHVIATIEIFTGMSLLAVMTGLVFARFSRPQARFVFADHPIVTMHNGLPTLMIRVANARHNTISGATAQLWIIRVERTTEGHLFRRFIALPLQRSENPIFALSWTLLHVIDETSPLIGLTSDDLARGDAALTLSLTGFDANSAQQLNAYRLYSHEDIRWQHRYVDITITKDDGQLILDYDMFHHVMPEQD
jgi:inward rectifier potassium channel